MEHFLFVLLFFPRLKSPRALSEAKKINKRNKEYFIPQSYGNEPLKVRKILKQTIQLTSFTASVSFFN